VVDDNAARPASEDRRQDRETRPFRGLSDGGGHGVAWAVPADTRCHRGAPSVAVGSMLSASAGLGRAGRRQENRVQVSPDRARFSVRRRSPTDQIRRAHHLDAVVVAKATGSLIRCLIRCVPGGLIGRPSGECRFKHHAYQSVCKSFESPTSWITTIVVPKL